MVNAFRYGLLGISDIHVGFALGMILLFIVAAWAYCLHLLETGKRLRQ
jgi:ABC-2 type transport system permease protein